MQDALWYDHPFCKAANGVGNCSGGDSFHPIFGAFSGPLLFGQFSLRKCPLRVSHELKDFEQP